MPPPSLTLTTTPITAVMPDLISGYVSAKPDPTAEPARPSFRIAQFTAVAADRFRLLTAWLTEPDADLAGIPLQDALDRMTELGLPSITYSTLHTTLTRHTEFHDLTVYRGRVRLKSDMLVQALAAKHQEKTIATTARASLKRQTAKERAQVRKSRKPARVKALREDTAVRVVEKEIALRLQKDHGVVLAGLL